MWMQEMDDAIRFRRGRSNARRKGRGTKIREKKRKM
jgi:hypothetical protein